MPAMKAEEAVQSFFKAFNRGDLEAVVAFYEPTATLVAQPGQVVKGLGAVRKALIQFLSMKPAMSLERSTVVTAGELALSVVRWSLDGTGPDGTPVRMSGTTSDVLSRQVDGSWRFVIDNPWGAGILG